MSDKYKLEDGTEYKPGDTLKLEEREYHQSTHYINKHIEVDDVIEEFGSLQNFEKGLYFDWNNYSTASDEDKKTSRWRTRICKSTRLRKTRRHLDN